MNMMLFKSARYVINLTALYHSLNEIQNTTRATELNAFLYSTHGIDDGHL